MNADTVRELLSNATPGPWAYELDSICQGYEYRDGKHVATWLATVDHENREDYTDDGYQSSSAQADRDAALMAAAPAVAQWGLERDAEVARLREALERVESQIAEFEVNYRGTLRGMDGWYGPLYPEDDSSMGVLPALRAALEGTS